MAMFRPPVLPTTTANGVELMVCSVSAVWHRVSILQHSHALTVPTRYATSQHRSFDLKIEESTVNLSMHERKIP